MQKSFLKILTVALVVGLNWGGFSAIGYTISMFNDTETSSANLFIAGAVDFTLDQNDSAPEDNHQVDHGVNHHKDGGGDNTHINLKTGDVVWKDISVVPVHNSNPFQYYVKSDNFSGDSDFCDSLNVDVGLASDRNHSDDAIYSGALRDLLTGATTTLEIMNYEVGAGTNHLQNKVCNFDIVYNGWQTRHNYPTYENGGFSDTESVPNTISSWGLRLNKVYYDVASDRGSEGDNEWVEIYNQTSVPLDISGWDICDNTSCDTIPSVNPIPAMGYGVITATSTTWGYWYVPSEVVKIELSDARIGNGLGNDGDALYLKRPDGLVVDEMNWQSNTDVWNPGAVDVAEGNLLARVPNGYDTNSASDWVELAPPAVDLSYPDETGSYSWYWGSSYNIQWTALNPNGDDADLAVDLYYIKDVNHDGVISEGDTKHPIVKGTENDGSYTWTLPGGFIGYIWIELVATGPENPMLNTRTVSGDIWDPLPIFVLSGDTEDILKVLDDSQNDEGEVISGDDIVDEQKPEETEEAVDAVGNAVDAVDNNDNNEGQGTGENEESGSQNVESSDENENVDGGDSSQKDEKVDEDIGAEDGAGVVNNESAQESANGGGGGSDNGMSEEKADGVVGGAEGDGIGASGVEEGTSDSDVDGAETQGEDGAKDENIVDQTVAKDEDGTVGGIVDGNNGSDGDGGDDGSDGDDRENGNNENNKDDVGNTDKKSKNGNDGKSILIISEPVIEPKPDSEIKEGEEDLNKDKQDDVDERKGDKGGEEVEVVGDVAKNIDKADIETENSEDVPEPESSKGEQTTNGDKEDEIDSQKTEEGDGGGQSGKTQVIVNEKKTEAPAEESVSEQNPDASQTEQEKPKEKPIKLIVKSA